MKKIWIPILFITLLLLVLVGVLYNGIRIDNLSFSSVKITGLYIKLDKKLFVDIKEIKINKSVTVGNDLEDLDYVLDMLPSIYSFFDTILIEDLSYENENATVVYKDEIFYLDSSRLTLKTKIGERKNGRFVLNAEQIYFKDFKVEISGDISADMTNNDYEFDGFFKAYEIDGKLKVTAKNDILTYNLSSNEFKSPKALLDAILSRVELSREIANWIYGYTKAASYQILSLDGKVNLSTMNPYPKLLKARVVGKDVNVSFHKNVPAAHVSDVLVDIGDNKIVFTSSNATYEDKNATADVVIYNLIDGKTGIKIDLTSNAYFDESINKILKGFIDIELPIKQTGGRSNSSVTIDVKLADIVVNVFGNFTLQNANISIAGTSMFAPHANIELNNTILKFNDTRLRYDTIFDISANGTLNASEKEMNASSLIHFVNIEAKNSSIVSLSNISTPFTLNIIENGIKIFIEEFDTTLEFGNKTIFNFGSLRRFYPYSEAMRDYNISRGRINIQSSDFKNFTGFATVWDIKLPLSVNGSALSRFMGAFNITPDSVSLNSFDNSIKLNIGKSIDLNLTDLDLVFDLNTMSVNSSLLQDMPINFKSSNGKVIIKPQNATIIGDKITLNAKNGSISANINYKNGSLDFVKNKKGFSISGNDMGTEFLNALANKDFFSKGTFNAIINGESEQEFFGTLTVQDTKLKEFKILNNIIAFFNTIPALATLNDPAYSTQGFPVKSGVVDFVKTHDFVYIQTLFCEGYSSDIKGLGYVNLQTGEIFLDLHISTIKSLSNIIDKIPLVNFIVLGEDGTMEISVAIRGTLDDPRVETNVLGDTLLSPLNIIKRVFQLPFHIFQ